MDQEQERTGKHISGWKTKRGTGTLKRCTLPQQAMCKWILCNFLREKKYTMQIIQEWQSRNSAICQRKHKAQQVNTSIPVNLQHHAQFQKPQQRCGSTATWAEIEIPPSDSSNRKSLLLSCWLGHHLNGLCLQSLTLLTSEVSASQSKETFSKQQNSTLRNTNQLTGQRQQSQCYTHSNSLSINFMIRKEILKALWTVPCNHHPNAQQ